MSRLSAALAAFCLASSLAAPTEAQPVSPLYQAARDAGASALDAAGLAAAMRPAVQEARLISGAAAGTRDDFAYSVSISGEHALVGAPYADAGGHIQSGVVYVFVREGASWVHEATLVAGDAAASGYFGISVSLSGDRALVGAPYAGDDSGSAYVFAHTGSSWVQEAKITAGNASGGDYFGYSVSLSADRVLVGAPGADRNGKIQSGAAYVFVRSGTAWVQEGEITDGPDAGNRFYFGDSVSLSGDRTLIGLAYGPGAAYVFSRAGSAWTREARLTSGSTTYPTDDFGTSVSLSEDHALVGAPRAQTGGQTTGSAYLFTYTGGVWTQEARLMADDAQAGDFFGGSVSLLGERVLVGAEGDDNGQYLRGSAYVFTRTSTMWVQQAKLNADEVGVGYSFGRAVSLSNDYALIGAFRPSYDPPHVSGAAFIFGDLSPVAAEAGAEARVSLSAPLPNPTARRTALTLTLDRPQIVRASLVDALGREMRLLFDAEASGTVRLDVDTASLAPGMYVVRVQGETFAETRRLTVVR